MCDRRDELYKDVFLALLLNLHAIPLIVLPMFYDVIYEKVPFYFVIEAFFLIMCGLTILNVRDSYLLFSRRIRLFHM